MDACAVSWEYEMSKRDKLRFYNHEGDENGINREIKFNILDTFGYQWVMGNVRHFVGFQCVNS